MTVSSDAPAPARLDDADISRVLVVIAHPDDAEYGNSAAVAAWTDRGVEVAYLLLTAGEAGMQLPPEETAPLRAEEQRRACDVVGVRRLAILNFPDGMLEYGLELRRAIAREIREFRPDAVICGSGSLKVGWGLDHPDHRAAGLAAIDATRDADNRWVFPELARDEQLAPWGTTWLLLTGGDATHYVEVSDADVSRAVASLQQHRAYLAELPWHPAPEDFIPELLAEGGQRSGVPYAVTYEAHRLRG
ncbi:MAG: PIG-L deacetylase family protein [Leucobacter sp.]